MSGINDWLDLMPAVVTVQSFISRNADGAPQYGSPVSYRARVSNKNQLIRDASGEQVVARGVAWLATVDPLTVYDSYTLPDGTTPKILAVDQTPDEKGPLFTKVYFA